MLNYWGVIYYSAFILADIINLLPPLSFSLTLSMLPPHLLTAAVYCVPPPVFFLSIYHPTTELSSLYELRKMKAQKLSGDHVSRKTNNPNVVKVKLTLEQSTKAQSGSTGIATLLLLPRR
jgi:hypothetical protein